ncbi:GyrI-like domain-containing protein [Acidovorax sp. Root70]|uniref:GyrI-like domain-containing protein n=1 Tax=Acidovorax sp. Root70 TaxID=1736590 RepID=UPI0007008FCE|nr:GyrI-like domain-containing protein [Acidovorax sp. Root70]KRB30529.1 transcriptional regulator [Acidovorax sp. Root70]
MTATITFPAPTCIQIPAFSVAGISVRTRNSEEMNPAIARLGGLWNRFFSQSWERLLPSRGDDGRIFGVYSAYESDEHGAFDVTAGVAVAEPNLAQAVPGAHRVDIEACDYLVFTGEGEMPQMVIDTWMRIWHYFADNPQVQRRFGTDFEAYEGPDKVAIHVGVVL